MGIWSDLRCRLGWHKRLVVIQTFKAAQHIGCPNCRAEFAIHYGERLCVPWDAEFNHLYKTMGYDTETANKKWRNA